MAICHHLVLFRTNSGKGCLIYLICVISAYLFLVDPIGVDSLNFSIRGVGEDSVGITAIISYTLLDMLTQQPDIYSVQQTKLAIDRPIIWHIEHLFSNTSKIINFFETLMPGVYFLSHYDIPNAITEEDDNDLLHMCKNLSILPVSLKQNLNGNNSKKTTTGNDRNNDRDLSRDLMKLNIHDDNNDGHKDEHNEKEKDNIGSYINV